MSRCLERLCYWCPKHELPPRVFIKKGDRIPRCPEHGPYVRQANKPYRKRKK